MLAMPCLSVPSLNFTLAGLTRAAGRPKSRESREKIVDVLAMPFLRMIKVMLEGNGMATVPNACQQTEILKLGNTMACLVAQAPGDT